MTGTPPGRARRTRAAGLLSGVALVAATACGGPAPVTPTPAGPAHGSVQTPGPVLVQARDVAGLGAILVDGRGRTLYMFPPDHHQQVTCVKDCAEDWPPLAPPNGSPPGAGAGVDAHLLGSLPNPAGGQVVTYAGWPLYTYIADLAPGQATGQAIDNDGGYWYVMRPSGQIVTSPAPPIS